MGSSTSSASPSNLCSKVIDCGELKKLVEEGKVRDIWVSGASQEGSLWTCDIEDEIVPLLTSHPCFQR
ncbi:hypothetical protein QL285_036556 [Trifolium repens]|nr:hypothetical protein QL285_036556 [Trifolium repens]